MSRVKLNSDGYSKGNPGRSGGGRLLRSDSGMLIWAQADFCGYTSNMVAETKALLQGIRSCVLQGYWNVDIEVDSLVLVGIVQQKIPPPRCVVYEIRELFDLLKQCNFSINHVYRESNMAADLLSNIGCKEGKTVAFNPCNLPSRLKEILRLDRCGVENVRTRRGLH